MKFRCERALPLDQRPEPTCGEAISPARGKGYAGRCLPAVWDMACSSRFTMSCAVDHCVFEFYHWRAIRSMGSKEPAKSS